MQTVYTPAFFFLQIFQAMRPIKNWFVIPGETWHNIWSWLSNVFEKCFFAAMCSVCLWRRGDRRGKGEEWRGGASPSSHPHWKDYFKQIEMFWTYHFKQISKCTATPPPGLRTDPYLTNIFTCYFIKNVSRSYFCIIFNKFLLHIHAAACFKLNWFCSTGPHL